MNTLELSNPPHNLGTEPVWWECTGKENVSTMTSYLHFHNNPNSSDVHEQTKISCATIHLKWALESCAGHDQHPVKQTNQTQSAKIHKNEKAAKAHLLIKLMGLDHGKDGKPLLPHLIEKILDKIMKESDATLDSQLYSLTFVLPMLMKHKRHNPTPISKLLIGKRRQILFPIARAFVHFDKNGQISPSSGKELIVQMHQFIKYTALLNDEEYALVVKAIYSTHKSQAKAHEEKVKRLIKTQLYSTDASGEHIKPTKQELVDALHVFLKLDDYALDGLLKRHPSNWINITDFKDFEHSNSAKLEEGRKFANDVNVCYRLGRNGTSHFPLNNQEKEAVAQGLSKCCDEELQLLKKSGFKIIVVDSQHVPNGGYPGGDKQWPKYEYKMYQGQPLPAYYCLEINAFVIDKKSLRISGYMGETAIPHDLGHALDHIHALKEGKENSLLKSDYDPKIKELYKKYLERIALNVSQTWSKYATVNPKEYFAEGVRMYEGEVESRLELKEKDFGLFEYVQHSLKK